MKPDRWEVGSEFHWMGLPEGPSILWPEPAEWFLLGRHAVAALLSHLSTASRRLWIPSYFCHDVAEYWRDFGATEVYSDNLCQPEPDWATLQPVKNDIVLAVNYFGVRRGRPWQQWRAKHDCILLEDHSHDPVSGWARRSQADYAFSSLRKTMPVPDGAILWSPQGHQLAQAVDEDSSGWSLKLAAMIWKREYLEGRASASMKALYREWQHEGEVAFDRSRKVSAASRFSRQYLAPGMPTRWRRRRVANVRRLLDQRPASSGVQPLFSSWPSDSAPLAAIFRFALPAERETARKRLEEANIYCPVHWPVPAYCDSPTRDLAATILTVPTDYRYGKADTDQVASILFSYG